MILVLSSLLLYGFYLVCSSSSPHHHYCRVLGLNREPLTTSDYHVFCKHHVPSQLLVDGLVRRAACLVNSSSCSLQPYIIYFVRNNNKLCTLPANLFAHYTWKISTVTAVFNVRNVQKFSNVTHSYFYMWRTFIFICCIQN